MIPDRKKKTRNSMTIGNQHEWSRLSSILSLRRDRKHCTTKRL